MYPIRSSHLALRFYRSDGWTEEILNNCLINGDLRFFDDVFEWGDMSYWIGRVCANFDVAELWKHTSSVFHFNGHELKEEEAKTYMQEMNWN